MKIPYKVQLRLSDFWNILEEETDEHGQLVITGALVGKTELIVAVFPQQHGPKGSWKSSEQWALQE